VTARALHTFILENVWTIVGLKALFIIPSILAFLLDFVKYLFHAHRKFHNQDV